jgi:hypothetical protein
VGKNTNSVKKITVLGAKGGGQMVKKSPNLKFIYNNI